MKQSAPRFKTWVTLEVVDNDDYFHHSCKSNVDSKFWIKLFTKLLAVLSSFYMSFSVMTVSVNVS